MPKKVPNHKVVVGRDGLIITVNPGQSFDFKQAEIDDILAADPEALRDPINEDPKATIPAAEKPLTKAQQAALDAERAKQEAADKAAQDALNQAKDDEI